MRNAHGAQWTIVPMSITLMCIVSSAGENNDNGIGIRLRKLNPNVQSNGLIRYSCAYSNYMYSKSIVTR